jgi:hypothetical protein
MKKIKDLVPEDFSIKIDADQFQRWKEARLQADKIGLWMFLICWVPGAIIWDVISPDLTQIIIWVFLVSLFFIWRKPNRLAKEMGINGKIMEEARDNIKIKDYPGIDPIIFRKWRKSIIVRRLWTWLTIVVFATITMVVLFSNFSRIVLLILSIILLIGLLVLIFRPYMLARKLGIKK